MKQKSNGTPDAASMRVQIWAALSTREREQITEICEVFDAKLIDGEVYEQGK